MQHQSQDLSKGPSAGKTGILADDAVIRSAEIEHYIAQGKRMQAEAVAAALSAGFRRVSALFAPRHHGEVQGEHLSRA
ncbi:MAG: hypothetical protein Tsb0032_42970 [Kiloniellaceae bacterium]